MLYAVVDGWLNATSDVHPVGQDAMYIGRVDQISVTCRVLIEDSMGDKSKFDHDN